MLAWAEIGNTVKWRGDGEGPRTPEVTWYEEAWLPRSQSEASVAGDGECGYKQGLVLAGFSAAG